MKQQCYILVLETELAKIEVGNGKEIKLLLNIIRPPLLSSGIVRSQTKARELLVTI
jgi:hypothetical protein